MIDSSTLKSLHPDDDRYSFEAIATQLLPSVNQILQIMADLQSESAGTWSDKQKRELQIIGHNMQLMLLMLTDPQQYHDKLWEKYPYKREYFDYVTCDTMMRVATIRHHGNVRLNPTVVICDELVHAPEFFGELDETQRAKITNIKTLARNVINEMREMSEECYKVHKENQP
jgi:hypothetical protein